MGVLSIAGEFGLWHWRATTANVRLFPPRCLHVWDTSCQFTSYQREPAKLSAHLSFVSICARAHLSCPCQLHVLLCLLGACADGYSKSLIWAFCDVDHTPALAFHGDNHA